MPKFFVKDEQVDGENIKIVGEDVNHIVNVLRLKKEDEVQICNANTNVNYIANILSLGMCFLCGVFVPMNVMDRNVLKVSQFLPVYWYETVNETLGSYSHLTREAAVSVWKGIGLEAMFAMVFVCMILAVTRSQRQK